MCILGAKPLTVKRNLNPYRCDGKKTHLVNSHVPGKETNNGVKNVFKNVVILIRYRIKQSVIHSSSPEVIASL